MIDEKRLEELTTLTYIEDLTAHNWDEYNELLRLARLGLWAEKHGIPALKESVELITSEYCSHNEECSSDLERCYANQQLGAIAALPKDEAGNKTHPVP